MNKLSIKLIAFLFSIIFYCKSSSKCQKCEKRRAFFDWISKTCSMAYFLFKKFCKYKLLYKNFNDYYYENLKTSIRARIQVKLSRGSTIGTFLSMLLFTILKFFIWLGGFLVKWSMFWKDIFNISLRIIRTTENLWR